jgi:MoxR-like ATPase
MVDLQTPDMTHPATITIPNLAPVQVPLQTLLTIESELDGLLLERSETLRLALIALLAKEHLVLLGPPGTAKSQLVTLLSQRITSGAHQTLSRFQWLLTRYTTPDELFGPISVQGLKADEYRRVTTGKLPEAQLVFLDEIFKGSSAVLNALLTILNERAFDNGTVRQAVPLLALFGASNELPQGEDLSALWDRFALRYVVSYVSDSAFGRLLRLPKPSAPPATLALADLMRLQDAVSTLPIPESVLDAITTLRKDLTGQGIIVSDRRWRTCLDLVRAHTLLEGRTMAEEDDLSILAHALWVQPEQHPLIARTVARLANPLTARAVELADQAAGVLEQTMQAQRAGSDDTARMQAAIEANSKLKRILADLKTLHDQTAAQGRNPARVAKALSQVQTMHKEVASLILDA